MLPSFKCYYGRFLAHWARELRSFGGEQIVGIILAVLILIFQIRGGLIPSNDVKVTAYATILWPYLALIGIYLIIHWIRTPWKLDQDLSEKCDELEHRVRHLESVPPNILLTIQDVVLHRTGDAEWRWKNGEFLVQVSAELLNLPSATVEYSAQLVFRGEVVALPAIKDVDRWEIIERAYYQQLYPNTPSMLRPRQGFVTHPAAITENLTRSIRNEGWLHFQIEGMGETDIAKRTLRLYATSTGGGSHADEELSKHYVVRSDLVAMRK